LTVTAAKTKQRVIIPLANPTLRAILAKHGNRAPKGMTNQRMNAYLKELCRIAGFTAQVEVNRYRAGRHDQELLPKYELVSTHTARRSFATNAFKRGMAAADIMKFTGHTTIASFMKYIKTTTEESAVILADHEFFTGKSPLKAVK
jgi:integrase